jgi:light-regulated signal transduction histidine kinase (bacteriophytochrome)
LALLFPHAEEFNNLACGLLSLRIAIDGPDFLLLFRTPVVQVVRWAGNPEKPVEETEAGRRISPRRSFEEWKQTFRDRAEPWTNTDRKFASSLRAEIGNARLRPGPLEERESQVVRCMTPVPPFYEANPSGVPVHETPGACS